MTDQGFREYARRIRAQCERLDVLHSIDLRADHETLKAQVCHAMSELGLVTGISPASGDFVGLVEHFTSARFRYYR